MKKDTAPLDTSYGLEVFLLPCLLRRVMWTVNAQTACFMTGDISSFFLVHCQTHLFRLFVILGEGRTNVAFVKVDDINVSHPRL